jgi:hypothetical protein
MNAARYLPLGLVAVLLGGCTYPEFDFGTGGAGAAAGQVAGVTDTTTSTSTGLIGGGDRPTTGSTVTSGGVTSGVTSSSITSSVTSAATGGNCAVSHEGGGSCEYRPNQVCGCNAPDKCSVTDETTGKSQCTKAGSLGAYQPCSDDNDCAAGTWCDHFANTCGKICASSADCTSGGVCFSPLNADLSESIPGLGVCTANCSPLTGSPCGNNATCTFDSSLTVFDCFASLNRTEGQACTKLRDCGKGLACLASGTCAQWCVKAADCKNGKTKCTLFNPAITVGGTSYGFCQ